MTDSALEKDISTVPPVESRPRGFLAVEIVAAGVTLGCVWLTGKESLWCWPVGIVGCVLYAYVFYCARLYSDVLLQGYFLVTSIIGWFKWGRGSGEEELAVCRLSLPGIFGWSAVIAGGILCLGWYMRHRTRAALPYWDAATTVLSLVAQYLLTDKILENWVLWIAVDVIAMGVYLARRLYLTAVLYLILLALAVQGLLAWL